MTKIIFHHDPKRLPPYTENCHPVQLYDKHEWNPLVSSCIARPIIEKIRDLGCRVTNDAFDFLTIAMAVTAADTFCLRDDASDSWSRQLELEIPLFTPNKWRNVSKDLEKVLGYLTGDMWTLKFISGGLGAPNPKNSAKAKKKKKSLKGLDGVCLFSGGLDSAVGAIDLINGNKKKVLLVSHAYNGDALKQNQVETVLMNGSYARLPYNADPHIISSLVGKIDITMRGRSFNFLAMAVLGLSALQEENGQNINTVYIPENGYISLNPPLTRRRIGSLSTRTTHPYYLTEIQKILHTVGFNANFMNPYQFKTKGEMLQECKDQKSLKKVIPLTVSCSNWRRKGIQCGRCVPCIIRRAAIFSLGVSNDAGYESLALRNVKGDARDDLLALTFANMRLSKYKDASRWVRDSGPLPDQENERKKLIGVFSRGLKEVDTFLKDEKIQ